MSTARIGLRRARSHICYAVAVFSEKQLLYVSDVQYTNFGFQETLSCAWIIDRH